MTVMADRSGRPAPVRRRMKTLTQAALNADKTVEQVEDVLDGLGKTMAELNSSLSQLNSTVERLEDGRTISKVPCTAWTISRNGSSCWSSRWKPSSIGSTTS